MNAWQHESRCELCICIYVCMYVCMYVCIYIYIYIYITSYTLLQRNLTCKPSCACACTYTVHVGIHLTHLRQSMCHSNMPVIHCCRHVLTFHDNHDHKSALARMHVRMHACVCLCMYDACMDMHVWMDGRMHACTYGRTLCMCTCMYVCRTALCMHLPIMNLLFPLCCLAEYGQLLSLPAKYGCIFMYDYDQMASMMSSEIPLKCDKLSFQV